MQNPFVVTIRYVFQTKIIADDVADATQKAKKILGIEEKKFKSIDCKVDQIPLPVVAVEKTSALPFKNKKEKK